MPEKEFQVEAAPDIPARVDVFLAGKLPELSRSRIHELAAAGGVLVNSRPVRPSRRVRSGDRVAVVWREETEAELGPQDVDFGIRHSDDWILVVEKPSGLVVHPGAGVKDGTLANGLLHRYPELAGVGDPDRPGIVHRLDKETSGLLVVARTREAYLFLQAQFRNRQVHKIYLALVMGRMPECGGVIDRPLGRHWKDGKRMSVKTRKPRDAETRFIVLEEFRETSLLEIAPVTGRTHQIRVHMSSIGHPLAGDTQYKRRKTPGRRHRLFLHAHRLSFVHPGSGETVTFISELPADLEHILGEERRLSAGTA